MKLQYKFLLILILFIGVVLLNGQDVFAMSENVDNEFISYFKDNYMFGSHADDDYIICKSGSSYFVYAYKAPCFAYKCAGRFWCLC